MVPHQQHSLFVWFQRVSEHWQLSIPSILPGAKRFSDDSYLWAFIPSKRVCHVDAPCIWWTNDVLPKPQWHSIVRIYISYRGQIVAVQLKVHAAISPMPWPILAGYGCDAARPHTNRQAHLKTRMDQARPPVMPRRIRNSSLLTQL
jgi:hypothetical protein